MAKFMKLKICNSKDHAVQSGKWKNPGASFYDQLLNAFYCDGDIPTDSQELKKKSKEGKYLQWNDFLKEAYLIAPIEDIKNSPYGITPYSRSGCKYPHHVIRNGGLVVSIPGLRAAYSRAKQMGEFSGEVKDHLERHYKELGIYEDSSMQINEKIERNFRDIERAIYEQTGIDLHCPTTIYEEEIENGSIRPLLRDDVTNPYFIQWLFRSYEFSDDDPTKFDYDMLVNNDAIGNYAFGYFVNDKLEGIVKVKHRKPEDYYAISMLFVNDQNESNGIGQTLMKYVIDKFGDKEMRLNVFAFNTKAIHIYKKYGFDIAKTITTEPEADGKESKLTGLSMHKMVRKPNVQPPSTGSHEPSEDGNESLLDSPISGDVSNQYDPPMSFENLPDHLRDDPVHAWRAKTGIELIHKEPTIGELERIWKNWNLMSDIQKKVSDDKSIELFGMTNAEHYANLVKEYNIGVSNEGTDNTTVSDVWSLNTPEELLSWMKDHIQYGWIDASGKIAGTGDDDDETLFFKQYHLQSPLQLIRSGVGVCWDQAEFQRNWFTKHGYPNTIIYFEIDDGKNCPSHSFLIYKNPGEDSAVYWFEHSWGQCKGIYKYDDLTTCVRDVINKCIVFTKTKGKVIVRNMNTPPKYGCTCDEFMNHAHSCGVVDMNDLSYDEIFNEWCDIDETYDLFDEASHGKLKHDFRLGWDYDTGHMIKVVYSLDNINVTDVGDFYYNYSGKKDGATHDSHLDYTKKNIKYKGNTDHQSTGQKVLAIVDTVTNQKLQSVKLLNPFCDYINTRASTQPEDTLKKARVAASSNPNFLSNLSVGDVDNAQTFKSTHWASRVMDNKSGENLRFNKIAKSETLKSGRGWKVNNIDARDFPIYGDSGKYMTYHNPNKKQALQELYMREKDILNYLRLNIDKPGFRGSKSHRAELHNLQIIQRDINTIQDGEYDLSIMKKYRESDEGRLVGLSGNQLLEYNTYMDFRPSITEIERSSSSDILEALKESYMEGGSSMDDDNLDWITAYLMEEAEPDRESEHKYEITHKKSKYKGWTEYTVHAKDGKEAASCIINSKTGDCADVETKPKYRRQGYMQYLLKYLIKFKGVKYAQVRQDNRAAISLYRKIGFNIEFKYNHDQQGPMFSMVFEGDPSKLIVEGYVFTEAEEPPAMPGEEQAPTEELKPEKESMPKKTDKAESSKNGVRRKKLYIAFIEWCKEYNSKNTFGSIFDKDAFNVSYPFVPEEMRYFYRLANPMLCVLAGDLTFFAASELRKLNAKNSHLNEMMIFAATPNDVRVFNVKDKKIYLGTEENGAVKLGVVLGDTFDTYIQKMINKGDILNSPLEEAVEFCE